MASKRLEGDYRMSKGLTPKVPRDELESRYKRLQSACEEFGFDAVLVYGSPVEPASNQ